MWLEWMTRVLSARDRREEALPTAPMPASPAEAWEVPAPELPVDLPVELAPGLPAACAPAPSGRCPEPACC